MSGAPSAGAPPAGASSSASSKAVARLTPMLRHYLEVKAQHPNAIVLYRMGDFYELFFEDAETAAPILEVQLTARHRGTANETPMCGVPHHAIEGYLGKLVSAGYRVAVCDQIQDPAEAKGLVERAVTRVVTPGTITELALLDSREPNLLVALLESNGEIGAAFLDISTGAFYVQSWARTSDAIEELARTAPKEALLEPETLDPEIVAWLQENIACRTSLDADQILSETRARDRLSRQLGVGTLRGFGLEDQSLLLRAAATALDYAADAARSDLDHVRSITLRRSEEFLYLDDTTLSNLEVLSNQRDGSSRSTLRAAVDTTVTAGGGRLIRDWLTHPLLDPGAIESRLDAVEELVTRASIRGETQRRLRSIADIERLAARSVLGSLTPSEAGALRTSLDRAPEALDGLGASQDDGLLEEIAACDPVTDILELLTVSLVAEPPSTVRAGGVIADGFDPELDRLRSLARDGKQHLAALEAKEREQTGIGSLKVRYNRVFGYYLEVTKAHQDRVPEHYVRKQTLTNAERYFTDELKQLEEQVLGAEERQIALEEDLFDRMRLAVAAESARLRVLASALSRLDVLCGLAAVAAERDYCRPRLSGRGGELEIEDGRHPVVERTVEEAFVGNDLCLDGEDEQIVLLTGPNMGGKSTYLRQVALISLLAQAGSFVPARRAVLPLIDRIFTRVGASDNLARGESTFMVEMIETSNILRYATDDSLIILDEVGRGTATFDGLSLAWAIVEHLHESSRAKTLFATHYHELTELATLLPRVVNRTMAVKEWQERIVFLHRVVPGSADKSYGIQVARLAGLPESVTRRAAEVLRNLESDELDPRGRPRIGRGEGAPKSESQSQLALFSQPQKNDERVVASVLREADLDQLTPMAALNLLQTLKSRLED